jgi:Skp family chaperone for outer membrane proteins
LKYARFNWRNSCLSLLLATEFAVGAGGALAQTAHWNIGVVDRDKVVTGYGKAQQAAEELKKQEDRVHKLIEESNKQYEESKAAHKPPAELEGLQKRLQNQIDDEVKKVQARAQVLESQLESEIDSAIKAEAETKKVDTVLMKQAVLIGGTDLTDGVVKRLGGTTTPAANNASTKPTFYKSQKHVE